MYNFALPPLMLHALHTGSARVLSAWAAGLRLPSPRTTFFNFLASHDGIGLNPARGILPGRRDRRPGQHASQAHGGLVSYKHNPDGTQQPLRAEHQLLRRASSDDPGSRRAAVELQVDRFMAAQAIMLALAGVPGIYFHSLFGSRGWPEGVAQTGHNRTINRQKLARADLDAELADPGSRRAQVFGRYRGLLRARARHRPSTPTAASR